MAVLMLMVVFTGLGLAMLHASGVHMKINAFRRFSVLLDCASENGLKRGLRDLTEWLETAGPAGRRAPPEASTAFARTREPDSRSSSRTPWAPPSPGPRGILRRHGLGEPGRLRLRQPRGQGRLPQDLGRAADRGLRRAPPDPAPARFRPRGLAGAPGRTSAPAGHSPLYKERRSGRARRPPFSGRTGSAWSAKPGAVRRPGLWPRRTDGVLPDDPCPLVAKALRIGIFGPGDLSPARLQGRARARAFDRARPRRRLPHRERPRAGRRLRRGRPRRDGPGRRAATPRSSSSARAARSGGSSSARPGAARSSGRPKGASPTTSCRCPSSSSTARSRSLGGGAVGLDGTRRDVLRRGDAGRPRRRRPDHRLFGKGDDLLAPHPGGRALAGRHPLLKDTQAQLVIYAAGRDVVTGEPASGGGIAVAESAPDDLKLQASLTAASGGFRVEGDGEDGRAARRSPRRRLLRQRERAGPRPRRQGRRRGVRRERSPDGLAPAGVLFAQVLAWKEY